VTGFAEYDDHDGLGLAGLVRDRQVSPADLVEECIARIERVNGELNAVVTTMYQQARAAAKQPGLAGPFAGVPFLLKDLLQHVPGVPTTSGCRFMRSFVPDHETELASRYRKAGLVFVGKTNTPELGIVPVTEPELHGPTRNPWDPSRTCGGSSGGAATAVASGMVPMAHGGDGGGSIRIPASCCGVFGLKPTRARNPFGPDASEGWNGFVVEHVLTRSVRDSAAMLDVTAGPEPTSIYFAPPRERPWLEEVGRDPGKLRIAFSAAPAMTAEVHPDCVAAVHDAAKLCEELGHHVEEVRPGHAPDELARAFFTLVCGQTAGEISDLEKVSGREAKPAEFEDATWVLGMLGRQISAADYTLALRALQAEARRLVRKYEGYDVVLAPTLGQPPLKIGALHAQGAEAVLQRLVARTGFTPVLKIPGVIEQAAARAFNFVPFTPVANFTGCPSMSVPLYENREGLPIGTMFTGRFGDEATLFRLAAQLEQARPWRGRRPRIHASR
jgi:amidase